MGKIKPTATKVEQRRPSICFHHMTDGVVALENLDQSWMIQMLKQFKVFGGINWNDISKYKGLGWDKVPQYSMEYKIPRSVDKQHLYHLYITKKSRVWGYREGDAFNLVWFDPDHEVTP